MSAQRELVRARAGRRCEYCHMPDFALDPADFHVEHILARQHGGTDEPGNLAWACAFCNLYKGPNLTSLDPDTGELVPLFHPRRDSWDEQFALVGSRIEGKTPKGRTTAWLLQMNSPSYLALRASLIAEGRF